MSIIGLVIFFFWWGFVQIADDMYPPFIVTQFLITLAKIFPQSKLVPERDLAELAFRYKKELVSPFSMVLS